MSTSGTTNFTVTRDQLVQSALRLLQVYGIGDTIPAEVITNASQALNIWVKALVMKGLFLWCVEEITVPLVVGQAQYSIGPLSNQPRPLRILDAFIRHSTGNDVSLTITSRYDYDTLGMKAAQGIPNQLYYDPQLDNGIVTFYNVPFDATSVVHLVIQRQIQDFNLATDNPDFPQEAIQMLKWGLADEIGMEQGARDNVLAMIAPRAQRYMEEFAAYQQEQASVFFTPASQTQWQGANFGSGGGR